MAEAPYGHVAPAAVKQVSHDIVGKTIGCGNAWNLPSKAPRRVAIEWEDFNYPPALRLIHFKITELPKSLQYTARYLNMVFLLTTFVCVLNLVDSVAASYWAVQMGDISFMFSIRIVMQSSLHAILIPMAALLTFYVGYRGIAVPDGVLVARFQIAQVVLGIVSINFALWPVGCVNGLARLLFVSPEPDGLGLLVGISTIIESSLWVANFLLAIINVVRVRRVNVYPEARAAKYLEA